MQHLWTWQELRDTPDEVLKEHDRELMLEDLAQGNYERNYSTYFGPGTPKPVRYPIPDEMRWEVWERDNFTCQHCGSRRFLAIDHRIPVIRGGLNIIENLQTLCKTCNSIKHSN